MPSRTPRRRKPTGASTHLRIPTVKWLKQNGFKPVKATPKGSHKVTAKGGFTAERWARGHGTQPIDHYTLIRPNGPNGQAQFAVMHRSDGQVHYIARPDTPWQMRLPDVGGKVNLDEWTSATHDSGGFTDEVELHGPKKGPHGELRMGFRVRRGAVIESPVSDPHPMRLQLTFWPPGLRRVVREIAVNHPLDRVVLGSRLGVERVPKRRKS